MNAVDDKNKILNILTTFKNNFDYTDIKDYQNLILFLNECIKENEDDEEIISMLLELINSVEENKEKAVLHKFDKGKQQKPIPNHKKPKRRETLSAAGIALMKKYEDLEEPLSDVISFRIFKPDEKLHNYMIK